MSIKGLLDFAAAFWFIQQVNDVFNAFLNRKEVPKLYWLSAAASFMSGFCLFVALFGFLDVIVDILKSLG